MCTLQGSYTYTGNIFNAMTLIVKAKKKHKQISTIPKPQMGAIPCKGTSYVLMSYYKFVCRHLYMHVHVVHDSVCLWHLREGGQGGKCTPHFSERGAMPSPLLVKICDEATKRVLKKGYKGRSEW